MLEYKKGHPETFLPGISNLCKSRPAKALLVFFYTFKGLPSPFKYKYKYKYRYKFKYKYKCKQKYEYEVINCSYFKRTFVFSFSRAQSILFNCSTDSIPSHHLIYHSKFPSHHLVANQLNSNPSPKLANSPQTVLLSAIVALTGQHLQNEPWKYNWIRVIFRTEE